MWHDGEIDKSVANALVLASKHPNFLTIHQRPGVKTFRFWQEGPGYDRNLTEASTVEAAIDSIHLNPVRRGLCQRALDWHWSSARFYYENRQDPRLPRLERISADLLNMPL